MQGGDWSLKKATDWNAIVVQTTASGSALSILAENPARKETIVRVTSGEGWLFVGASAADVQAGKGHPMLCGEMLVLEGYSGPLFIASESGQSQTVHINEITC